MFIGSLGPVLLMVVSDFFHHPAIDFMLGDFQMPSGIDWVYILFLGIFATLAQFYMTKAYLATKAGLVAAASYMNIIFSIMVGVALGDDFPQMLTIFGICLIILGGVLVAKKG